MRFSYLVLSNKILVIFIAILLSYDRVKAMRFGYPVADKLKRQQLRSSNFGADNSRTSFRVPQLHFSVIEPLMAASDSSEMFVVTSEDYTVKKELS